MQGSKLRFSTQTSPSIPVMTRILIPDENNNTLFRFG